MLGTYTNSPATVGFDESSRPTVNIGKESATPAIAQESIINLSDCTEAAKSYIWNEERNA